jgi:hypothetical protein
MRTDVRDVLRGLPDSFAGRRLIGFLIVLIVSGALTVVALIVGLFER